MDTVILALKLTGKMRGHHFWFLDRSQRLALIASAPDLTRVGL